MSLLKLVGVLLDYPQDELWRHGEELLLAAADPGLPRHRREDLQRFVRGLLETDTLLAQDRWLSTFDRGRSMSLLMFEHIHGESRDRGQAMVDLIGVYRKHGFELAARELPDYLPLLLEYLSQRPPAEASDWLRHLSHIIGMLGARASERLSPYALLFELLVEYSDGRPDLEALRRHASEEPRDDTPQAMDRLWEEEAVRFGTEAPDSHCAQPSRKPARPGANRSVQS